MTVRLLAAVALALAWHTSAAACPVPSRDQRTGWDGGHALIGVALTEAGRPAGRVVGREGEPCPRDYLGLVQHLGGVLDRGGIVILGEVHDNGEQHWLRGVLITALAEGRTRRAALVFEHLRVDQQAALDALSPAATAAELFAAVDWARSGWPASALFDPLMAAARATGWPILAGDPAAGRVREVARGGPAAIEPTVQARLGLDRPLAGPLHEALLDELEASHCGLVARERFANMALAQRYRDAHLAERAGDAAARHGGAILLTGNGHARRDRGAPLYLRRLAPAREVLSVLLLEADPARLDADAMIERAPSGAAVADIVIVTPRAVRDDPCAGMRQQMRKNG